MGLLSRFKTFTDAYKIAYKTITDNNYIWDRDVSTASNTTSLLKSTGVQFQTDSYEKCSPLQAIITKKAQALTTGNIIPTDKDGMEIPKNAEFEKAIKVINNPNSYQTKDQFLRTLETFVNVYGTCFVYKVTSVGFGVTGMIVIPNSCITIEYKTGVNTLINEKNSDIYSYTINLNGVSFVLRGEDLDLIHEIQDVTINLYKPSVAKSRIDALRYPIENIVASQESRNTIVTKMGAIGMLTPDRNSDTTGVAMGMGVDERERLQKEFAKYGTLKSQWHTLISKIPMRYTSMTKSVNDLGLFDGENADNRALASSYGVPVPLLSLPDTTKFNTYLEAKRELYEDTIIPESEVIAQAFNIILDVKSFRFAFDYSHLTCMQTGKKEKSDVFSSMVTSLNSAVEGQLIPLKDAQDIINNYK